MQDKKSNPPEAEHETPPVFVTWDDVCVCCGALVPEGTQICAACKARFLTEE